LDPGPKSWIRIKCIRIRNSGFWSILEMYPFSSFIGSAVKIKQISNRISSTDPWALWGEGVGGGPKNTLPSCVVNSSCLVLDLIFFITYQLCYTHFSGRSAVESSTRGTSLRSIGNAPPVTNVLQQRGRIHNYKSGMVVNQRRIRYLVYF